MAFLSIFISNMDTIRHQYQVYEASVANPNMAGLLAYAVKLFADGFEYDGKLNIKEESVDKNTKIMGQNAITFSGGILEIIGPEPVTRPGCEGYILNNEAGQPTEGYIYTRA
jgi:hypothetical protein